MYVLQCTVCQSDHGSKSDWHQHLTSVSHQERATQECVEKWHVSKVKQCCLVVYSSFSITRESGGADKIIKHFSKNPRIFVTDFVSWKERPRLGVIQFESRAIVRKLLAGASTAGLDLVVDNQSVKIKAAEDVEDLEWFAILPDERNNKESSSNGEEAGPSVNGNERQTSLMNPVKRTLESATESVEFGPPPTKTVRSSDGGTRKAEKHRRFEEKKLITTKSMVHPIFGTFWTCKFAFRDPIPRQFATIRQLVSISDEKYDSIVEISETLQSFFQQVKPTVNVVHFRNWTLKLKTDDDQKPLFYVYDTLSYPGFPDIVSIVQSVFNLPEAVNQFTTIAPVCNSIKKGIYLSKKYKYTFTLTTAPAHFVEMQVHRLTEYMCTFDPRCYPVITLLCYWIHVNNIKLGKGDYPVLPEAVTVTWMVIHFFCHMGLIPTVRDIQNQPHEVVKESQFGIDVGFSADPQFAEQWRKQRGDKKTFTSINHKRIVRVFQLFADLLTFYGKLACDSSWIVNTKDGEMIDVANFLAENPTPTDQQQNGSLSPTCWSSKMSTMDLAGLRVIQMDPKTDLKGLEEFAETYKRCKYKVNFESWKLYMVHPFMFTRRFTVFKNTRLLLEAMQQTAQQLQAVTVKSKDLQERFKLDEVMSEKMQRAQQS